MTNNSKQRILLLSDLWGKEKSSWITYYSKYLESSFEVKYYDSLALAEINTNPYTEENLHQQFLNGGVEKAVKNLLKIETEEVIILGFSIGGLIAWKAWRAGLKTQSLFAISATRLRYETQSPKGLIQLFYGEEDPYKPKEHWFQKMPIKKQLFPKMNHELYRQKEVAENICHAILKQSK